MPNFSWEPLDFPEALGVVPVEEEYGISFQYFFSKQSVSLELTIWPFDGDVELLLRCEGMTEPLVCFNLHECPGARVVRGRQSTSIEFSAAKSFGGRYDHVDAPRMDSVSKFNRSSR
jgi:hypothetical protein